MLSIDSPALSLFTQSIGNRSDLNCVCTFFAGSCFTKFDEDLTRAFAIYCGVSIFHVSWLIPWMAFHMVYSDYPDNTRHHIFVRDQGFYINTVFSFWRNPEHLIHLFFLIDLRYSQSGFPNLFQIVWFLCLKTSWVARCTSTSKKTFTLLFIFTFHYVSAWTAQVNSRLIWARLQVIVGTSSWLYLFSRIVVITK